MLEPGEIHICRACMRQIIDGNYTEIVRSSIKNSLYELIFCYIPEFEIEVENPCLCYECFSTLYLFHKFKRKCLRTEEDLRLYLRERPEVEVVDLSDVLTECGEDIGEIEASTITIDVPLNQEDVSESKESSSLSSDNFGCNICGEITFASRVELYDHLAEVHDKNEENTCLVCNIEFPNKLYLERHHCIRATISNETQNGDASKSKTNTNVASVKCAVCQNCYISNELKLKERLREIQCINSGTVCLLCMKVLKGAKTVSMHVQNEGDALKYKCPVCEKTFTVLNDFNDHMRDLHSDTGVSEKKACPYCKKILNTRLYDRHIQLHNQPHVRKYTCSLCKWVYFSYCGYEKHLRAVHNIIQKMQVNTQLGQKHN